MLTSFLDGRYLGARYGSGPVRAIALAGWRRDHQDFRLVGEGLPFTLAALDLPGFGSTPPPHEPWGTERYARAAAEVLEELGGELTVVGHSFGGRVAAQLAASRPGLVSSLVLTGVPLVRVPGRPASAPPRAFRVARALHRRGILSDQRMESFRRKYGSADYRAASGVMRDVLVRAVNESYDEVIEAIRCPVELVWGGGDDDVPVAVAEELQRRMAQSHLTVVAEAGHLLPLEAPGKLRDAIVAAVG